MTSSPLELTVVEGPAESGVVLIDGLYPVSGAAHYQYGQGLPQRFIEKHTRAMQAFTVLASTITWRLFRGPGASTTGTPAPTDAPEPSAEKR
ncbi:hypothetical protein E7Z53_16700 [Kocuria salina]|uniref:hypothetical protein n=1 Tax=Kocuria salina TaxID=1929416 RepID=UPI0015946DC1|nr:hypothetical protein [Kocuria salina]NVC25065.1 hypothetical protein [Kocuria salina]